MSSPVWMWRKSLQVFFFVTTYLLCPQAAVWNPPMLMWIVMYIVPCVGNQVRYVLTGATFFMHVTRLLWVRLSLQPNHYQGRGWVVNASPGVALLAQSLKSGNNRLSRWDVCLFSGGSTRFYGARFIEMASRGVLVTAVDLQNFHWCHIVRLNRDFFSFLK